MSLAVGVEQAAPEIPALHAAVTSRAQEFCEREGLTDELTVGLALVRRHFPSVRPEVDVRRDPETDEQSVGIHVRFRGSRADFAARYRQYVRDWVAATHGPGTDRFPLSYSIG